MSRREQFREVPEIESESDEESVNDGELFDLIQPTNNSIYGAPHTFSNQVKGITLSLENLLLELHDLHIPHTSVMVDEEVDEEEEPLFHPVTSLSILSLAHAQHAGTLYDSASDSDEVEVLKW
jgi:hypothetical protein